jgi:hypothetical protein
VDQRPKHKGENDRILRRKHREKAFTTLDLSMTSCVTQKHGQQKKMWVPSTLSNFKTFEH